MKYLLDVNVLLAAMHANHPANTLTTKWLTSKQVVLCPLSELGFLRISSNPKALGVPMESARTALEEFTRQRKTYWIPDDLPRWQQRRTSLRN